MKVLLTETQVKTLLENLNQMLLDGKKDKIDNKLINRKNGIR